MAELRPSPSDRTPEDLLEFGVVNLDKPPGPSAHEVSAWIRDLTGRERAAHAGTLDPKVTGVLPTLLGTATRLVPALLQGEKEYVAVLELHDEPTADLEATLAEFEGRIYQKPPRKSAVARRLRVRTVHELTAMEADDRRVLLRIRCESGTYVRKLCHDLGLALGTGAHMGDLRRTATGPFDDSALATLHDLADALARWEEDGEDDWLRSVVEPGERAISHLPDLTIAMSAAEAVADGAPVYAPGVVDASVGPDHDGLVACFTPNGAAVCLGRLVGDPGADAGEVVDLERVLV
ncbi:MAG: RNA-guided pseudouridylation complex pseudouridine synthase subunit Cbf5 [Halodesulfurarchaeum sp.]